jgi:acyl-CoA synthetase (AMP-forming)/AMP-acid ligase II
LQDFCASHLDRWSCPDSFEIIEELPRDPNGKVLKRVLRQQAWSDAGRSI